ncbi:unnamed protein product [Lampetra planeri]
MALRRLPGVLPPQLAPVAPLALALLLCAGVCTPAFPPSPRRSAPGESPGGGGGRRSFHRVQHGACVYTFLLPEVDGCRATAADRGGATGPAAAAASQSGYGGNPNALPQRDAPASAATPETEWPQPRLQQLETLLENNTQWLRKLEGFIQDSVHSETAQQQQQTAVHNQTAAMLQIGTSLLSHTAEQTRKLSDVEAQVLNQTTRLEIQLLENSLSTNKLEREVLQQTHDISRLHDKNSLLERKVVEVEQRQQQELLALRRERDELQQAVVQRGELMDALERRLLGATHNQTVLQRQQAELTETVRTLLNAIAQGTRRRQGPAKEDAILFSDCADAYEAGLTASGVYTVKISDSTEAMKVYCNMESQGGGWTVIQHRENGATDFHRPWQEYKMGFGDVAAEHWMGNQHVYYLSHQQHFVLRVELRDWEGNVAFSQYERFYISSEKLNYRIYVKGYTGTAGKYSSFAQSGIDFSTKDMDNDNCACKCAQMATGGWWFDACGPSNLNGMYYTAGQNTGKFNGIKWHYWKGSSYSLRSTTMMIRPVDFGV